MQAAGLKFRDRLAQPDDPAAPGAGQFRQPGDEARGGAAVGDLGGERLVHEAARQPVPEEAADIAAVTESNLACRCIARLL